MIVFKTVMEIKHYITLGSAKCPHSIRQSQANASNNVTTLFCDAILPKDQDPETASEIQKMCHYLREGKFDDVKGVPANFTCTVPITNASLLTPQCTVTMGFDENFGKPTLFEKLDADNDGVLSQKEFAAGNFDPY